jgi:hypothetical protein
LPQDDGKTDKVDRLVLKTMAKPDKVDRLVLKTMAKRRRRKYQPAGRDSQRVEDNALHLHA